MTAKWRFRMVSWSGKGGAAVGLRLPIRRGPLGARDRRRAGAVMIAGLGCLSACLAAATALAQPLPGARKGLEFARTHCAMCHAVEAGNRRSVNPAAPAFSAIAASPGMSEAALHAALQSPHRFMPDILLTPADRANVVAYIISLKAE